MKKTFFALAIMAAAISAPALAQSASVATDPNAPTSNFASPGNTATAGYDIYLADLTNPVRFRRTDRWRCSRQLRHLYFDIDPTTGTAARNSASK